MRIRVLAAVGLVAGATALPAQSPLLKPEIRPFAGASIPTGPQRDLFDDAFLAGVQVAVELKPTLHVVGTFGWTPSRNTFTPAQNDVNIFQYNAGVELGFVKQLSRTLELRPFIGAGAGGRSYNYQSTALADRSCFAAYGALGTEFQVGRAALRLEARDNVFCYKFPVAGPGSETRNDLAFQLGLAYHFR